MKFIDNPLVGALIGAMLGVMILFGGPWLLRYVVLATVPPEKWVELTDLRASDTVVGVPPILQAGRTIHRSFLATVVVTLRKKTASGRLVTVCDRFSVRHLIPQAELPDPVTLDFWSHSPPNQPCRPETTGTHVVTLWVGVDGDDGVRPAPIEAMSNEFEVTEERPDD